VEGLAGSTSATKAVVKLTAQGDSSRWATWRVTSTSAGPGYKSASVQPVQSVGVLVAGEEVILSISRNGDKGDTGANGSYQLVAQATVSTAVANVDFLNVFTSAYDTYVIEIQGMLLSSASSLTVLLAKAGAADSAAVYYSPVGDNAASTNSQTGLIFPFTIPSGGASALSATLKVRNANSATLLKAVSADGFSNASPTIRCGGYYGANAVTGFRLIGTSVNITAGTIRVYGIKNT
jgi:hypothetical protein